MKKKFLFTLSFFLSLTSFLQCEKQKIIMVGFVSNLSGNFAEQGAEVRNAVIMAADDINNKGGIHGKKISLLIRDDQHDNQAAIKAVLDLMNQNIVCIIGHTMSSMSLATLPLINKNKMLMISPTSTVEELSGKDDYFIRLNVSYRAAIEQFAEMIYNEKRIKKVFFIYELTQKTYSLKWYSIFKDKYESLGGKILSALSYQQNKKNNIQKTLKQMATLNPEGLVIVASPAESASICKEAKRYYPGIHLFISGMALTESFLLSGGKAVEGAMFPYNSIHNSDNPKYLDFSLRYQERFGNKPSFYGKNGYETMLILSEALNNIEKTTPDTIKNWILQKKRFSGLTEEIEIDRYGDRIPFTTIYEVKKGKFVRVK